MEAIRKKLKSRRGASIFLAMLLMLVCVMTGATVLAAASSNAGRVSSEKKEHQKYLTLYSTLNMVVDDLQKVVYNGSYTCTVAACDHEIDGTGSYAHSLHYTYSQNHTTDADNNLLLSSSQWYLAHPNYLPLYNNLNYIFAQDEFFRAGSTGYDYSGDYKYPDDATARPDKNTTPGASYTLEVTVDVGEDGYGKNGFEDPVLIQVSVNQGTVDAATGAISYDEAGYITVKAGLKNDDPVTGATKPMKDDLVLEAKLKPKGDMKNLLALATPTSTNSFTTQDVKWELVSITKTAA